MTSGSNDDGNGRVEPTPNYGPPPPPPSDASSQVPPGMPPPQSPEPQAQMPPPQSPAWSYQQAPSPNPRRESSGGKAAAIIIACGLVVAVIAGVVVWFLVSNNDEFPYTVDEMNDAQIECQAQKMAFGTEELECLRDELPELSDDELRRLDHVIEEQGGVPYGS